ncbi:hypothetical protein [Lentzea aerocolonigenes]|uniref:hypothetical protein n=1 Tax=Lentzea aerocolonigenes TaxID=68170 RepID=UPI0012DFD14B|nr:hypothetical protein [Lentzea aerocolonigenes]
MADHVHNVSTGTNYGTVVQTGELTITGPAVPAIPVDMAARDPSSVVASVLTDGFTGRAWLIARIDAFVDEHPCGYVWVEAGAGMGKTALAAHLAQERGWICHFSRYAAGWSIHVGLQNLASQLIIRYDLWRLVPDRTLPDWMCTPGGFEQLLSEATAAAEGEKVVLLVDGADEAEAGPQPWGLPSQLPAGVYVVGTYRTGGAPARCESPHAVLRLSALDDENLEDLRAHLLQHAPAEVPVDELAARCGGVWIYLRYVLEEIRLGLRRPEDLADLPGDLMSYYLAQLTRWREDEHWHDTVLPLVSTFAVAGEALPLDALARLSGADQNLVERWCLGKLRPFLTAVPGPPRLFEIYHASLFELLTASAPPQSEEELAWADLLGPAALAAHSRIADQCLASTDSYALRHLTSHLLFGGRPDDLDALLSEEVDGRLRWFTAHDSADSLDRYVGDLNLALWHHATTADAELAADGVAPSLPSELRYLLMITSIGDLTERISLGLLRALAATKVWSPQRTISYARRTPSPYDHVLTLATLLPILPAARHPDVLDEALAVADWIPDPGDRTVAVAHLAAHLPQELRDRTFAEALALTEPDPALAAFKAIAPHLTTGQLEQVISAVTALESANLRRTTLIALAPYLSEDQRRRTLPAAALITDQEAKNVLANFPLISLDYLPAKFAQGLVLSAKVSAAADVVDLLPEPERSELRRTALAELDTEGQSLTDRLQLAALMTEEQIAGVHRAIKAVDDSETRISSLAHLVPFLPAGQRADVARTIAAAIAGPDQWGTRARLLPALAEHLPVEGLAALFEDAIRLLVKPSADGFTDTTLLLRLAPHLPAALLPRTLEAARNLPAVTRANLLTELAPLLPADLLPVAVELAESAEPHAVAVNALIDLSRYLPTPRQQQSAVASALAASSEIHDRNSRIALSVSLIPHLPDDERRTMVSRVTGTWLKVPEDRHAVLRRLGDSLAFLPADELEPFLDEPDLVLALAGHPGLDLLSRLPELLRRMSYSNRQGELLSRLAPRLSLPDRYRALAAAYGLGERSRATALIALLPHLPDHQRGTVVTDVLSEVVARQRDLPPIALDGLAPHLTADHVPLFFSLVERVNPEEDNPRSFLVQEAISVLPAEALPRAEALVSTFSSPGTRARVRAALALRSTEAAVALAVKTITDHLGSWYDTDFTHGVDALASLIPRLSPERRQEALAAAMAISDDSRRTAVLTALVGQFPADERTQVIDATLETLYAKFPSNDHAPAELAPFLSADQLPVLLALTMVGDLHTSCALLARAAELSDDQLYLGVLRSLLSANSRRNCMEILAASLPSLCAIGGPDTAVRLLRALEDVQRWWP